MEDSGADLPDSLVRSLGMYWQRDLIAWRNNPRMYGRQQALAKPVDFDKQKGIYNLYDQHTVVCVGRTIDRLGSRWNRFSWLGLLDVTQEGCLSESPIKASSGGCPSPCLRPSIGAVCSPRR